MARRVNEGKVIRDKVRSCWGLWDLMLSEMESICKTIMLPGESQVSFTSYVMLGKHPFKPHIFPLQDGHDHAYSARLC